MMMIGDADSISMAADAAMSAALEEMRSAAAAEHRRNAQWQ